MQFNMNKSEISDDSRLFKIQGDLNLIDHEINSVCIPVIPHHAQFTRLQGAAGLLSSESRLTYLEGGMARMSQKLDSLEVMLSKMCVCAGLDSTISTATGAT
jgi:hypothetical protein